jgi:hypothetical protein
MTKAAKIGLLLPADREAYHLRRPPFGGEALPCIRCGAHCYNASGARRGVYFTTRVRGSKFKLAAQRAIHQGCIPDGSAPVGIPAGGRRAVTS